MSDIWIRKMRTHFRRFDFDKDGVVSRSDFVHMPEKFSQLENLDSSAKEAARKQFSDLFSRYTKAAGTKHDVSLTEDLLIESVKMQRDDPEFQKNIRDLVFSLVTPMDVNEDGFLSYEEFHRNFESAGFNADFIKAAFVEIDANHDEKISFEEYANNAISYICSDDENTTALFGLLV